MWFLSGRNSDLMQSIIYLSEKNNKKTTIVKLAKRTDSEWDFDFFSYLKQKNIDYDNNVLFYLPLDNANDDLAAVLILSKLLNIEKLVIANFPYERDNNICNSLLKKIDCQVITVDLHNPTNSKVLNIMPQQTLAEFYLNSIIHDSKEKKQTVVISPDFGAKERSRIFANHINCDLIIAQKRRKQDSNEIETILENENLKSYSQCVIIDDVIATGSTILKTITALQEKGIKNISVVATRILPCAHTTHYKTFEKILNSVQHVITTDIFEVKNEKVKTVSIAELLLQTIT